MHKIVTNMQKRASYYLKNYKWTLLVGAAICYLSLSAAPEFPELPPSLWDKWAHCIAYGSLSTILWWEYTRPHLHQTINWKKSILMLFFPLFLGSVLELVQEYATTDRHGDWMDVLANTIGAVLGTLFGFGIGRYRSRQSSRHNL